MRLPSAPLTESLFPLLPLLALVKEVTLAEGPPSGVAVIELVVTPVLVGGA